MSNSRAKYEELEQQQGFVENTQNQTSTLIMLEVIRAANKAGLIDALLEKAVVISQSSSRLSPLVVLQLAAEEAKVDELCN